MYKSFLAHGQLKKKKKSLVGQFANLSPPVWACYSYVRLAVVAALGGRVMGRCGSRPLPPLRQFFF